MFKRNIIKKVSLLGIMLVLTGFVFSQNSKSNWILDYITDDFGDKTGRCRILGTGYGDDYSEYQVIVTKGDKSNIFFIRDFMWKSDLKHGLDVRISIKLPDDTIFTFDGFLYNEYGDDPIIFLIDRDSKLLNLMKASSELRIACRVGSYNSFVWNLDCTGFTKAYNEMLICK